MYPVCRKLRLPALGLAGLSIFSTTPEAAFDSGQKPASSDLTVARVSPAGDQVPAARQILITFDRAVVPVGDMRAGEQSPVSIEPSVDCHWHWLDPKSLACELDANAALTLSTEYRVSVAKGLRAEDGDALKEPYGWTFTTERPAVKEYSFSHWTSAGTPYVRLVFNQPVTRNSVEAAIRIGSMEITATRASDDQTTALGNIASARPEARRVWLVSPKRELKGGTDYLLTVSPGLRGAFGPLPGKESRTIVQFDTFPEFRFLGVRCRLGKNSTLLQPGSADARTARCNPLYPVSLEFSAPVIAQEIREHLQLTPELNGGRTDYDPWANVYPSSNLGQPHRRGQHYSVELPERLKAYQAYSVEGLEAVRDEFNRRLIGTGSIKFQTAHRMPKLTVTHPVAVLEKNAPTSMPLYVTNLTDIELHYGMLTHGGATHDLQARQPITRVWDRAYAVSAEVRSLLGGASGIITGSLFPHPPPWSVDEADQGAPNGRPDQDFMAEVTPFQVHTKLGQYNTLVWVTTLADGKVVPGARVRIYEGRYSNLSDTPNVVGEARTDASGVALLPGLRALHPVFYHRYEFQDRDAPTLMVRVDAGEDLALLPLDYPFAIDTYRASRGQIWSENTVRDHVRTWGATAQGVYKLGDTVDFKLYVRNVNNRTLEPVIEKHGYRLEVLDPTSKVVYEHSDLDLSDFGSYAGSFRIPPTAAVGWYQFRLTSPKLPNDAPAISRSQEGVWTPMKVLVADFTPAPFQVRNTLNGNVFMPDDPVEVSTEATLHAGGPYASAASRVTGRIWPEPLDVKAPAAAGFSFDTARISGLCKSHPREEAETVHESQDTLSHQGELTTRFQMPDSAIFSGRFEIEGAVRDERGKYVTSRVSAEFRGRDRFVGLRNARWTFEQGKPASVQYIVVGKDGSLAPNMPVSIAIQREVVTAARVKGAGNAFLTAYDQNWVPEASCRGMSSDEGKACDFMPSAPGLYSIQATVVDTHGDQQTSELCTWVTGKGQVMWQEPEDMSLSLVPEKPTYQVGDRARVLIRNPFPGATALVSIERYGVIKSWTQTLEGNTPVLDFKVEPDFLPGFYLSVLVVSPRVAPAPDTDPIDQNGVDLGRPTYRLGYSRINVDDPYKTLDVRVQSDRSSYKPGETVKLTLAASPHIKGNPFRPVEFAVAVLDESVFDLIQDGKSYFDPYKGFYQLEPLDLENFGLLTRLIGLQKFEKKGANAGGDGGAGFDMRSVSKYLAYWNPSVMADNRGRAKLQFQLPDNLTGWRVFAIATTATDQLGLGDYKFKSSKLTELRPVMPNQLTQGDRFTAGFSVLNRSDKPRTVSVTLRATGAIEGATQSRVQTLSLEPFRRETVWLPLATVDDGAVHFTASAGDASDTDRLAYTVPVHKRVSLEVSASYGTTISDQVSESVQFPATMRPQVGELSLLLAPTVIGNLDGTFRYIKEYPYECWEQRLTRALFAADFRRLHGYLPPDLAWPEADSLPQAVLDDAAAFQAPNGGMAFWVPNNDRVSPYLSAATALAFNHLRTAGYKVPTDVDQRLQAYLQRLLRERAAPSFYSEGMVSSVRAVALQALAERQVLKLEDLARYEKFAPQMDLFALAAYLQAAIATPGADALAADLARQVLAHANQSGGQFHFSEAWDDGYAQLLATPLRSECAILSAFLKYGQTPSGQALVGDVPFKLVRTITQSRGSHTHWPNTQENLYCAEALAQYSVLYENTTPALTADVVLGDQSLGSAKFRSFQEPQVRLTRPNGSNDAGRRAQLRIQRQGDGRLYYSAHLSYEPIDQSARASNHGFEIHREYSVQRDGLWQLLGSPAEIVRGELVRVDLYLSLPAARHFVVVDDPVPGGLEPVNRQLATASTVDADATGFRAAAGSLWFHYGDWSEFGFEGWCFYHQELRHDAARFYADYLPAGHYHLSYGAQAISSGQFTAAPAHAAEMYDPDVYGLTLPVNLDVALDVTHE
jgi:uncharacterized protein YfaS (alpha-2-macroglobulin family)